jgi:hypothetical protein
MFTYIIRNHPTMEQQESTNILGATYNATIIYPITTLATRTKTAKEEVLACMFLNAADNMKYGNMIMDFHVNIVNRKDVYLVTLPAAFLLMIN